MGFVKFLCIKKMWLIIGTKLVNDIYLLLDENTQIITIHYIINYTLQLRKTQMQNQFEDGEIEEGQQVSESDQQFIRTTKAGRTDLCKCCRNALSKYTCPRCAFRTCSLTCTKKHKQQQDCKGYLDPAQKIAKSKITQKTTRKDYQFVSNMISGTDKVRKCLTGITNSQQQPKRFYFLKKQAKTEYNIRIHQAPGIIERHRQNISFYYMKTKEIFWVIQLLYFKKNKKYTRQILIPTADSKSIKQIIPSDFLCTQLLTLGINTQKKEQFRVFVENRDMQSSDNRDNKKNKKTMFSQVSQQICLRDAVRNKNIYQFPTLILVHNSLVDSFCEQKNVQLQKYDKKQECQ